MNARERFNATMHYLPRDRSPIMDFGFWDETLPIWTQQGFPCDADSDTFFGMDPQWISAPINVDLSPPFSVEILEDKGETEILRDASGVIVERGKYLGSIPRHLQHTLTDRLSWETHFLPRLDHSSPERYPPNWGDLVKQYKNPARSYPLGINAGSLFGRIRDWMGLEGVSYIAYDDPALFSEMVMTAVDCTIGTLSSALESGIQFDYASMWEDMCYRSGPLLSPAAFAKVLVPQYKRLTSFLAEFGIDIIILDCDGDISRLIPLWLDGGVNTMFPIEVGVWNADPVAIRSQFGPALRLVGGFDKHILAGPLEAITAEVERLAPLVDSGGYIPTPDHRVPPDVPFANYLHYLHEARRVWGKNQTSLRPIPASQVQGEAK